MPQIWSDECLYARENVRCLVLRGNLDRAHNSGQQRTWLQSSACAFFLFLRSGHFGSEFHYFEGDKHTDIVVPDLLAVKWIDGKVSDLYRGYIQIGRVENSKFSMSLYLTVNIIKRQKSISIKIIFLRTIHQVNSANNSSDYLDLTLTRTATPESWTCSLV